jgi:hypothetical protein
MAVNTQKQIIEEHHKLGLSHIGHKQRAEVILSCHMLQEHRLLLVQLHSLLVVG